MKKFPTLKTLEAVSLIAKGGKVGNFFYKNFLQDMIKLYVTKKNAKKVSQFPTFDTNPYSLKGLGAGKEFSKFPT